MVIGGISVLKAEVEKVIEEIQYRLRADGGDIELVDVDEEGVVKVRLKGSCLGCPMSQITLKWGVERYLKRKVPQVKRVVTV
jgi:Fe-S cluster biogenesis protein NfuA